MSVDILQFTGYYNFSQIFQHHILLLLIKFTKVQLNCFMLAMLSLIC